MLQYQFKFFIEITTYVYLGFAVQYSFLRKFGYSTLSFGLLQATVAAQWAIIWYVWLRQPQIVLLIALRALLCQHTYACRCFPSTCLLPSVW